MIGVSSPLDHLRLGAERNGSEPAYTFLRDGARDQTVNREELWRRVLNASAQIQQLTEPGDRVLVAYPPGLDFIVSLFGCLHAGAIAVPVYPPAPNQKHDRVLSVAADCQPSLALVPDTVASAIRGSSTAPEPLRTIRWSAIDTRPAADTEPRRAPATNLALLQYTSGSTGHPKGVMITTANLTANIRAIGRQFAATPADRAVFWLPPYHDMGLIGGIFSSMVYRVHTTLMSPASFLRHPFRWLEMISKCQATITGAPNFAYALCITRLRDDQLDQLNLASLQVAFCGAEPIDVRVMRRFAGRFGRCGFSADAIYPCYGLAESTLMVTGRARGSGMVFFDTGSREIAGCGWVTPEHEIRIVDPHTRRPAPDGTIGEIWIRGPSVAVGYWNKERESEDAFEARLAGRSDDRSLDAARYLRTGDLGFIESGDAGRELYVTGRIKDVIIVAGRKLHPEDLEAVACYSHPLLTDGRSAAFTVDEGIVLVHEVDRRSAHDELEDARRAVMRALFESHGIGPHRILFVPPNSIPATTSGKVRRAECRRHVQEGLFDEVNRQ